MSDKLSIVVFISFFEMRLFWASENCEVKIMSKTAKKMVDFPFIIFISR